MPRFAPWLSGILVALLATVAHAADLDTDGYDDALFPYDCDDTTDAISPNDVEVVGNLVDEDCDGHDGLGRRLMVTAFGATQWVSTGYVQRQLDTVKIGGMGQAGSIRRTFTTQPIARGSVRVALDVHAQTPAFSACTVTVATRPWALATVQTDTYNVWGAGTFVSPVLAVHDAPRKLAWIDLACDAGESMTVDWLTIQNAEEIFPPTSELSIAWEDVEAPGGGYSTTVVRSVDGDSLYAASDVGGVARWAPGDAGWVTMNGSGATGLVDQAHLGVWDVLPVDGGAEVWALTGHTFGVSTNWNELTLAGTLSYYEESTDAWTTIAESHVAGAAEATGGFEDYGAGGYGRYGGCSTDEGGPAETYAGGKLLAAEPLDPGVLYFANGDSQHLGVGIVDRHDTDSANWKVCALPTEPGYELPAIDGLETTNADHSYVRALARVESTPSGLPVLLVGYLGRGAGEDSLFQCQLPTTGLACTGATTYAKCEAIDYVPGLDVRDIEVDPMLPELVYLADGGRVTGTEAEGCTDGYGGVWTFSVTDDGAGSVTQPILFEVPTVNGTTAPVLGFEDLDPTGDNLEITGLMLDDNGTWLFAMVPKTHGGDYNYDRMYRIDAMVAASGTAAWSDWQPVNMGTDDTGGTATDGDERAARVDNADPSLSWLYADTVVEPDPNPERWAPGQSIDGVWVANKLEFLGEWAVFGSTFNIVAAHGLDDTDPAWDPEDDTVWRFYPAADPAEAHTVQHTVVNGITEDHDGNLWMPMWDLGLLLLPEGGVAAERDCWWDALDGGGADVAVGDDNSVWLTFWDQGVTVDPDRIAVVRRTVSGTGAWNWGYQGAAIVAGNVRTGANDENFHCVNDAGSPSSPRWACPPASCSTRMTLTMWTRTPGATPSTSSR